MASDATGRVSNPASPRLIMRRSRSKLPLEHVEKPLIQQAKSLISEQREK